MLRSHKSLSQCVTFGKAKHKKLQDELEMSKGERRQSQHSGDELEMSGLYQYHAFSPLHTHLHTGHHLATPQDLDHL